MTGKKLKIDVRRGKILEDLRRNGKVSVAELAQALDTTTVTIRTDLAALEQDGYLTRIKGGAVVLPNRTSPESAQGQEVVRLEQKLAIAREVAARIKDGDTLFINSGTTCQCIAGALRGHKKLCVVTNSIHVARELGDVPSFQVLLLGGILNGLYGFTSGDDAQQQLGRYQADWAILSVDGVSAQGGVTTYHAEESAIDRMMLMGAKHVLVAADSSKLGNVGFSRVCACGQRTHLLTDRQAEPQLVRELQDVGMQVDCV